MENKKTKKDYFNELLAIEVVANNEDMVKFINHELELLTKKNTDHKPTKAQEENVKLLNVIFSELGNFEKGATVTQLTKVSSLAGYSNQKISALLKKLKDDGKVERLEEKGIATFKTI